MFHVKHKVGEEWTALTGKEHASCESAKDEFRRIAKKGDRCIFEFPAMEVRIDGDDGVTYFVYQGMRNGKHKWTWW